MNWDDTIIDAAATDTGMRRSNNQDSYTSVRALSCRGVAPARPRLHGRRRDGRPRRGRARQQDGLRLDPAQLYEDPGRARRRKRSPRHSAKSAPLIHSRASANRDFQGMGTTCSALLLLPEGALIAHVGDSRVYRVRRHRIDQLSFDHSLVWELVRRNHLTSEQASVSVPKNVITRSLGPGGRNRGRHRRARWPSSSATFSSFAPTVSPARSRTTRSARSPETSIPATPAATWSISPTCAAAWITSRS